MDVSLSSSLLPTGRRETVGSCPQPGPGSAGVRPRPPPSPRGAEAGPPGGRPSAALDSPGVFRYPDFRVTLLGGRRCYAAALQRRRRPRSEDRPVGREGTISPTPVPLEAHVPISWPLVLCLSPAPTSPCTPLHSCRPTPMATPSLPFPAEFLRWWPCGNPWVVASCGMRPPALRALAWLSSQHMLRAPAQLHSTL